MVRPVNTQRVWKSTRPRRHAWRKCQHKAQKQQLLLRRRGSQATTTASIVPDDPRVASAQNLQAQSATSNMQSLWSHQETSTPPVWGDVPLFQPRPNGPILKKWQQFVEYVDWILEGTSGHGPLVTKYLHYHNQQLSDLDKYEAHAIGLHSIEVQKDLRAILRKEVLTLKRGSHKEEKIKSKEKKEHSWQIPYC